VVTGAARGQGAETARRFAAEGARVVLTDVLEDEGRAVAAAIGGGARFVGLDITSAPGWADLATALEDDPGRLDVLVNNAGILSMTSLFDCTPDEFRRVLDVNVTGAFLGMRALARLMERSGGGAIVNVSSIQGMVGRAGTSAYTASKFGVRGLSKAAALELGAMGIRVNSLHPGSVATPMVVPGEHLEAASDVLDEIHAYLPVPRCGRSEDMAGATLFLASDDAAYITGTELVVDGGMIAGYPAPVPEGSGS